MNTDLNLSKNNNSKKKNNIEKSPNKSKKEKFLSLKKFNANLFLNAVLTTSNFIGKDRNITEQENKEKSFIEVKDSNNVVKKPKSIAKKLTDIKIVQLYNVKKRNKQDSKRKIK